MVKYRALQLSLRKTRCGKPRKQGWLRLSTVQRAGVDHLKSLPRAFLGHLLLSMRTSEPNVKPMTAMRAFFLWTAFYKLHSLADLPEIVKV